MGNHSFDDLLQALQSALVTTQDTLRKRREAAVARNFAEGKTGASRSPFFVFAIPQNGTGEYEMLSLPAASFRGSRRQQISMLSLEFACELRERKLPGGSLTYCLAIKPPQKKRWWRKEQHWMQIVFNGTYHPSGEVMIDGKLLMEIPLYGAADTSRQLTGEDGSTFLRLLHLLRDLWRPSGFTMTREQSARAREIL